MFKQILKILYASVRTFGSGTTVYTNTDILDLHKNT